MTEWQWMTDDKRTSQPISIPSPGDYFCKCVIPKHVQWACELLLHRGKFILIQRTDASTMLLLLINVHEERGMKTILIGYEDGELTIDGPITVPLADVVDWIGED